MRKGAKKSLLPMTNGAFDKERERGNNRGIATDKQGWTMESPLIANALLPPALLHSFILHVAAAAAQWEWKEEETTLSEWLCIIVRGNSSEILIKNGYDNSNPCTRILYICGHLNYVDCHFSALDPGQEAWNRFSCPESRLLNDRGVWVSISRTMS